MTLRALPSPQARRLGPAWKRSHLDDGRAVVWRGVRARPAAAGVKIATVRLRGEGVVASLGWVGDAPLDIPGIPIDPGGGRFGKVWDRDEGGTKGSVGASRG